MPLVHPSTHPLVAHKLAALRDVATPPAAFRRLVRDLAALVAAEATADLPTRDLDVATPMGTARCRVLADDVAIVPILRAAGIPRLKMIALIAAPEGIAAFAAELPDVPIHVGVIDARLNDVGYIDPGLGDAGDRQFNTF